MPFGSGECCGTLLFYFFLGGAGYLDWGVPTLNGGTYLRWGNLPWTGSTYPGQGVPTLHRGYLPWMEGTYPGQGGTYLEWGVPTLDRGYLPWGTPPLPIQSSPGSTCYVASGMPLAFTQNFLVLVLI